MNVYEYVFESVTGARLSLGRFEAQPLLLVNTASRCIFTPQLAGLQAVYNEYRQSNLVVIALPCNDFGEQEPATEGDIISFYRDEYHVTFPVTRKIHTLGPEMHPLFRALLEAFGSDILPHWNFTKYLFDTEGQLVERWGPRMEPTDPTLTHQIERNLQSWVF